MSSTDLMDCLHFETVTPLLLDCLKALLSEDMFSPFRLVGGTNLSLRFGHRISDDIDLFTDSAYGEIDFKRIESWLQNTFPYFDNPFNSETIGFGKMYYIGRNEDNVVKLDLMYTDPFISPPETIQNIRLANTEQIVAMKLHAISTGGRKKDWWDIHLLLNYYSLNQMLEIHKQWQPWNHHRTQILEKMIDFDEANYQPDPKCLLGKFWDLIKLDIIEEVEKLS